MVNLYKDAGESSTKEELIDRILGNLAHCGIWYSLCISVSKRNEITEEAGEEWLQQVKWNFNLHVTITSCKDLMTKRIRQRGNPRKEFGKEKKRKKNLYVHDSVLGQHTIDALDYHEVPWLYGGASYKIDNPEEINEFAGNFTFILPLGENSNLGIIHCSNRGGTKSLDKENQMFHLGSASLVEIPDKCMILFHANLYHYGARSQFKTYKFLDNVRAFAYMCAKGTNFPPEEEILPALGNHKFCQQDGDNHSNDCVGCDKCGTLQTVLRDNRCDEDNVWTCKKEVHNLNPGDYVMGDINTLGWVIVKAFQFKEGTELKDFVLQMNKIIGHHPFNDWSTIQHSSKNEMAYKNLIASGPYPELFKVNNNSKRGVRTMRITKATGALGQGILKTDTVMKWYDENLKVASDHVKYTTTIDATYQFSGHNMLVNSGALLEQSVHTDYTYKPPPLTAPSTTLPDTPTLETHVGSDVVKTIVQL